MDNDFFNIKIDLTKKRVMDKNDKIIRWPKKQNDQHLVLQYVASKFDTGVFYSEKDVNQVIKNSITFHDYVLIRRELIEKHYLKRSDDCKKYWVAVI